MSTSPDGPHIDRLDFDANRGIGRSDSLRRTGPSLLDEDVDFMAEVAEGILERDRQSMRREVTRTVSLVCAVLSSLCAGSITTYSLYAPRFLAHLRYTQLEVNAISIAAELGLYLPVPLFGYLCDRYSPAPLSLLASLLFGGGYLLAAFTYRAGPPASSGVPGAHGLPFALMVLAFLVVGAGTSSMYLSGVATCAKNFSTAKNRGLILALPIAAFGLSGVWQSQVGAHLLFERLPNGGKGDVDVFRYFLFLGLLLIGVGLLGALALRIVDEEGLINRGVEELERSGLLQDSEFFRPQSRRGQNYGTIDQGRDGGDDHSDVEVDLSESMVLKMQREEARLRQKKSWLLNHATSSFISDRTMWLLAAGFFLVTGPGEAYINNVGTIIVALTPEWWSAGAPPAGQPSSHISVIALTSTLARIFTGALSDIFAPKPTRHRDLNNGDEHNNSPTLSRLSLLIPSATLLSIGFLTLAAPLPFLVPHHPASLLGTSALVGLGYGASFSLVPIIISVVWGVENFATNWGIMAVMPAPGAALWSVVYSVEYGSHASPLDRQCHRGSNCFAAWAWGCATSVGLAIVLWSFAWRSWRRRDVSV